MQVRLHNNVDDEGVEKDFCYFNNVEDGMLQVRPHDNVDAGREEDGHSLARVKIRTRMEMPAKLFQIKLTIQNKKL